MTFIDQKLQLFRDKFVDTGKDGSLIVGVYLKTVGMLCYQAKDIESFLISSLQSMQEETRREERQYILSRVPKEHWGYLGSRLIEYLSSPKQEEKCPCHCHAGGNYKDCLKHEIITCSHCTPEAEKTESMKGVNKL